MLIFKIKDLANLISVTGNYDDDCQVYLLQESYNAIKNHNLKIKIQNSRSMPLIKGFQFYLGATSGNISIYIGTNDSKVYFCENTQGKYNIELWGTSQINIGPGTTSNGVEIICNNSTFTCGEDCMFSSDILFQSSDQHGIFDLQEQSINNNKQKHTRLGKHVWIGRRCTILPDVDIGSGSIVETSSVVSKHIPAQVVAAGSPAKVIKKNKTWSRSFYKIGTNELKYTDSLKESYETCDSSFKKQKIQNHEDQNINNPNADGKVTIGRSGRLFIANDSNLVIPQHRGEKLLSITQIDSWKHLITSRNTYCLDNNINYYMMVVPDAHAVYKEDLPALDNVTSIRPIQQIISNLNDLSHFIYPLKEMDEAKNIGEVYHPSDSHYSPLGAFVCYRALLNKMKLDLKILSYKEVKMFNKNESGDLGNKYTPPKTADFTECFVKNPLATKVWNNEVTNRGHMSLWLNKDKKKPKCLLLTDSYGWKIQRFLAESFSELFIVHSPLLEKNAIEKFKPDIVITLMAERFLIYTPNDATDQSAMSFAKEKGSNIVSYDEIMLINEKYKKVVK